MTEARETTAGEDRRVLVVEDDDGLRSLLEDELSDAGLSVATAASGSEALEQLETSGAALVVSDLRLPGLDGFELLRRSRSLPEPPSFLIITAFGTIDQAVQALKEGADDFLTKPLDLEHLSVRVSRILENRRLRHQVRRYREALEADDFHGMIGRSPSMRSLFRQVERVGRGLGPVLLQGESGVGKELAARAVHEESGRTGPFLAVNCAGVPESLLESEFFGHVKGAFSGATGNRPGLFEEASGGTLLLDEIGEMPPALQASLLRVLQEGTVRAVGSDRPREVDVRIIAATNRDLAAAMEAGEFRNDLFFRLETFRLAIPPLREREGDLELLAYSFIRRHAARLEREPPEPSTGFKEALRSYSFPGNVRELENVVERAVTFCDGTLLEPRHLPPRLRSSDGNDVRDPAVVAASSDKVPSAKAVPGPEPLRSLFEAGGLPTLRELEARYVRHVLEHAQGNKRRAAALLGVSRRTLYRKLDSGDGSG
ncbi:MAG: sigma-54 dependent transcriptional regulator [Gemmatimonadota bacterium]